jgi:hypothetical protein
MYQVSNDDLTGTTVVKINRPAATNSVLTKNHRAISLATTVRYVRIIVDAGSAWTRIDKLEVCGT